jgi:heme exporter protein D
MHDDQNNKDDGSVWTSYSDLFTTVAVIFLVMFVFALIKAGVSKMQTVVEKRNHEKELKAEVTKEVKAKTDQQVNKVKDSIQDISQYEDLIDQKMRDMNKFVNSLKENKKVLNDLIKDQQRKEAQLAKASELIKEQEVKIKVEAQEKEKAKKLLENEKNIVLSS